MDASKIFEQLAMTTHFKSDLNDLILKLPSELSKAYLMNDMHQLRKLISGCSHFPDTKTVATIKQ